MARLTQLQYVASYWPWIASQLWRGSGQRRLADKLGISPSLITNHIGRFLVGEFSHLVERERGSTALYWRYDKSWVPHEDRLVLLWGAMRGRESPPDAIPTYPEASGILKRRVEWKAPFRRNLGRPIDMGGPRDVWLTFVPGPDPRFDFMEPVGVEEQQQAAA